MRLARAKTPNGTVFGEFDKNTITAGGQRYSIGGDVELLAPCTPTAIYCAGKNYQSNINYRDFEHPTEPSMSLKPPVSVCKPGAVIQYPSFTDTLKYGGELAAILDKRCSDISTDEVHDVILGYTIMNDLDAFDQPSIAKRKVFDDSAPLGPWIETSVDPADIDIETTINGEIRQKANTSEMLFPPAEVISLFSRRITLQPWDVIAFGSPSNPGQLERGDEISIRYEGIGALTNTIAE